MKWAGSFAFLILIVFSATLPVLAQYDKSISSYGTVNYSTTAPRTIFAAWLDWKWTWDAKTPQEFTVLFDSLVQHGINMIFPNGGGIKTDGSVVYPPHPFDITKALNDYNKAHGTNIKACIWFMVWPEDWSNPPNLRDSYIQNKIIDVVRQYTNMNAGFIPFGGVPYDGVNLDFEWYDGRWDEIVLMTDIVADSFPNLIVSTDVPFGRWGQLYSNRFSKNLDYLIPMLYDTAFGGDAYADWFAQEAKAQLTNADKPVVLGVPSYWEPETSSHKSGENIRYALQGLEKLLDGTTYSYLHGISMFDYDHAEKHNVWVDWDKAVEVIRT